MYFKVCFNNFMAFDNYGNLPNFILFTSFLLPEHTLKKVYMELQYKEQHFFFKYVVYIISYSLDTPSLQALNPTETLTPMAGSKAACILRHDTKSSWLRFPLFYLTVIESLNRWYSCCLEIILKHSHKSYMVVIENYEDGAFNILSLKDPHEVRNYNRINLWLELWWKYDCFWWQE